VLQQFGCRINHVDYRVFELLPREMDVLPDLDITVESDWSSAAFLLVAAAIKGEVICEGLQINSSQADRVIVEILRSAGATVELEAKGLRVAAAGTPMAFRANLKDSPDLFPPLAILAAFSSGLSRLEGVSRLRTKESDRSVSIAALLAKMQIEYEICDDILLIHGGVPKGGEVQVFRDHRIAMAAAVAGCFTQEPMIIPDAEVVAKSYPDFFDHMKLLGASVTLN
jgi:3-phosphoshikimate 1-carboxyvinyltransferase